MNSNEYTANLLIAIIAAKVAGDAVLEVYDSNFSIEQKEDKSPLTLADKRSHEIIAKYLLNSTQSIKCDNIPLLSEEGKDVPYGERKNWKYFWLVDPLDGTKEFIKRNGEFTINIALIHDGMPVLGVIYAPALKVFYFAARGVGAYKLLNYDVLSSVKPNSTGNKSIEFLKKISQKLPLIENISPSVKKNVPLTVVASRSHLSKETEEYLSALKQKHGEIELVSIGSSLKFCLVAEGTADMYPRFGPTMEWDTAAGQAIAEGAGGQVTEFKTGGHLRYNKENLVNPWFITSLNMINKAE